MKLIQRILVAVDLDSNTQSVVDAATRLATRFGSEVSLMHVLAEVGPPTPEAQKFIELARQGTARELAELRRRFDEVGVSTAEELVVEGTPFDQVIHRAEDLDANVIVVGARRDGGSTGLRLGTTAERLCRKSPKPVWVVNPESDPEPRTILCPVDGSQPSRRALQNAIHLARRFDARLVVLHVVRPFYGVSVRLTSAQPQNAQEFIERETSWYESFLSEFDFHGVRCEKMVREGAPAETIVSVATEVAADLAVMGSVGRTGLSRILLGSVASSVARELPCSTVLMKAEDAIRLKLNQDLADLSEHFSQAHELLENGFPDDARRQFEHCIQTSDTFAPAWEGLADALERLEDNERAEQCRKTAQEIRDALQWRRVEADIRRSHPLWTKT